MCLFIALSLLVTLGSVPSSQTSLYRSPLWVRMSGQLQSLLISFYRSQGQVLSLPISYYRSLLTREMEKVYRINSNFNSYQSIGWFPDLMWKCTDFPDEVHILKQFSSVFVAGHLSSSSSPTKPIWWSCSMKQAASDSSGTKNKIRFHFFVTYW